MDEDQQNPHQTVLKELMERCEGVETEVGTVFITAEIPLWLYKLAHKLAKTPKISGIDSP